MPITAPPTLTNPGIQPSRGDTANFAARGDAFHAWLPTAWTNLVDSMTWIRSRTQEVFDWSSAAQADRVRAEAGAAAVAAANPVANAAAAAVSALDAQGYATLAQATNPDSPVRLNPRRITANLAIASDYNAASVGPIAISPGITVTVGDNATWSIH